VLRPHPRSGPHDVLILLPDGTRCALPGWMFDPNFCAGLNDQAAPRIGLTRLQALGKVLDAVLLPSPPPSAQSGASDPQGGQDDTQTDASGATRPASDLTLGSSASGEAGSLSGPDQRLAPPDRDRGTGRAQEGS
jgi:hypothetical protein